jgi:tRNA(Arg) A34 adenosine deaminase TadA
VTATEVWESLDDGWQASLEEAWVSWCGGSAGVGAAIVDRNGVVVARDRNRRLDRWHPDALSGSRIAHAEMCAISSVRGDCFDDYTLYTTFEPCLMCASAIMMCNIRRVHYAAADPVFAGLDDWFRTLPFAASRLPERTCLGGPIGAFTHVLHLSWLAFWFPTGGAIEPHRALAPRQRDVALEIVESSHLGAIATAGASVTDAIDALWPDLVALGAP